MNLKQIWKWNGQSAIELLENCSMQEVSESGIQEWKYTIPVDMRKPIVVVERVAGRRKNSEMARVIAVDTKGNALLRMFDAVSKSGWKFTVIPVSEARKFIRKCREQFNR